MDTELINLRNLINIDELEYLFSDFSDITNFTIGLVDVVTNKFLLRIGWREICTNFYRAYPESEAHCKESNKRLTAGLKQVGDVRIDHCQNGLVDACTPIVVQGEHLANLFTGPVLFSPPDLKLFKAQAQKFGYDEQCYLKSLAKVPVVDEKQISFYLRYLAKIMTFIAQKKIDFLRSNSECINHKELLQHIADLAPVGIGVAHNRIIQWANRAMSQLTGYSHEELTGLKVETLSPSAEAFVLSGEKIQNQFRGEGPAVREAQWKTKDGSLIDVYVNSAPLNNVLSGKTFFTALDITERKKDSQHLLDGECKYRELVNNISSGVVIFSAIEGGDCFVIDDLNNAALNIIQLEREKIIGSEISNVFPQVEGTGMLDVFRRVLKNGISETLSDIHYKDEKLDIWTNIHAFSLSTGQIVAIYNDFTEKKHSEKDLEKRRIRYEQVLDLAADAFCLGDLKGTIIDVNQQAMVLTGYSRDELLGQNISFLFSKAELKKSPLNFFLPKTEGVLMREGELLHKNGTTIPVEMHSKIMPDGTFQSFIRDITECKHSQRALLESQRDLKKKHIQLTETNTALKVLIRQAEQEKLEFEEAIATNILSLVEPHLKKLKISEINKSQADHIEIIESTLKNLVSPFVRTTVAMNLKLSPAEMQVANLIKQGKTSKQIADLLGLSPQTIDKHRSHIRKKIGITNKDISLRELLTSRF